MFYYRQVKKIVKKPVKKWKKPHKKYKGLVFLKSKIYGGLSQNQLMHWTLKKKYLKVKKDHILNFYTYYLGIKKTKLKQLLDLTINKLSRKRNFNTIFYPEWRLDVFLARLFNKTIENIHIDIWKQVVLVNNKSISIHYVLKNKDFIRIWKDKSFFRKKVANSLECGSGVSNHINFPKLNLICFLQDNSCYGLELNPIRQRFVKKSHIWQVFQPKDKYNFFLKFMFQFKMLDTYLLK